MQLPENKRRNVATNDKKKIWLYGAPFSGKTYLANQFPDPLMLNTDGNVRFIDAPFIAIKDEVKVEGRITKRTFAWEIFKDAIAELEKKQNDFKTIVVDLLEDTYEACRLYMYDQMGISHESDDSFRAWDKIRTEFLSTIKRLMNLDYENIILISHEDTSKDITKKAGDKVTAIKPNINDKAALKIAGMVDLVARVVNDEDRRTLSFKANEVVFGGGRLKIDKTEVPCDYAELCEVYHTAPNGTKNENRSHSQKDANDSQESASNSRHLHTPSANDTTEVVSAESSTENANDDTTASKVPEQVVETVPVENSVEKSEATPVENSTTVENSAENAPVRRRRKRI